MPDETAEVSGHSEYNSSGSETNSSHSDPSSHANRADFSAPLSGGNSNNRSGNSVGSLSVTPTVSLGQPYKSPTDPLGTVTEIGFSFTLPFGSIRGVSLALIRDGVTGELGVKACSPSPNLLKTGGAAEFKIKHSFTHDALPREKVSASLESEASISAAAGLGFEVSTDLKEDLEQRAVDPSYSLVIGLGFEAGISTTACLTFNIDALLR